MLITIQFNADNAAFEEDFAAEVLAAAKAGAERAIQIAGTEDRTGMVLRDTNGRLIGATFVDRKY